MKNGTLGCRFFWYTDSRERIGGIVIRHHDLTPLRLLVY
jgi:hypothetical protein